MVALALCLAVVAAAWIGWSAWAFMASRPAITPAAIAEAIGLTAGPLVMIALLWLIVARGGRGELRRYGQVSRMMRADAQNLAAMLALLTREMEGGRLALAQHEAGLRTLGESTAAARGDLGGALGELPRLAEHAGALNQRLHEAAACATGLAATQERLDASDRGLALTSEGSLAALTALGDALGVMERRLQAVTARQPDAEAMGALLAALAGQAERAERSLAAGAASADGLIARGEALQATLGRSTQDIEQALPAALARLRLQAERSLEAVSAAGPHTELLADRANEAREQIEAAATVLAAAVDERLARIREQAGTLGEALATANGAIDTLVDSAGRRLVEALVRVRETANQASDHAREAFGRAIPLIAADMGAAAGEAMEQALSDRAAPRMDEIGAAAQRAVDASEQAAERLIRQLMILADATRDMERRAIDRAAEVEQGDADSFSRTAALLIDALNSAAIDIARVLASDVGDAAWTAYLKGDRGVFTRRAARLLSRGEARQVGALYGENEAFRDQVNRYVHDFEAMLRRILSGRDGTPLAVTMLSSDMGKLYVALSQAIARLRL